MPLKRILLTAMLVCGLAPVERAQEPQADFRLVVLGHFDADTLAAFSARTREYAALRSRLEVGLTPLRVTLDADEIETFERRLTSRMRDARTSRRFQVFVPAMERQIRRLLAQQADVGTIAAIADDGPGEFDVDINDTYSKERPLSTMPTKILLLLPELPPDMEYRFVGRHLILRDVRANMIIDEIPHVLDCQECVAKPEEDHP
jgi:hypothetical protein